MSALPGPWNPITYAQFYVAGGWRVSVMVVGGYAALLGGGIYLSAAHDPRAADVLEAWAHGLLVLQAVILFGYGAFRVNAAVRSDLASRMIESHRLMPTRPAAAVAGYVLGAPAVPVVLFGVTAAIGAVCVGGSGGRVPARPVVGRQRHGRRRRRLRLGRGGAVRLRRPGRVRAAARRGRWSPPAWRSRGRGCRSCRR